MTRRAPILALSLLSGCMLIDNIGPSQRFSDTVHDMNEQARWGRLDLAVQAVAPAHRSAFTRQHRAWTDNVRVADVDVTNLEMHLPDGSMASTVTFQWIDESTMELHETTVRQVWVSAGDGYAMTGETIIGGEPDLLDGAPVREDDHSTSGDEEGWETVALAEGEEGEATSEPASAPPTAPTRRRDAQGMLID